MKRIGLLFFCFLFTVTLGCQTISYFLPATPTPTATPTSTPTPTPVPTLTPTPTPDYSGAALTLEDLPSDFEIAEEVAPGDVEEFETVSTYGFANATSIEFVSGSTFLVEKEDRLGFDMAANNIDLMLSMSGASMQDIEDIKPFQLEDLGDTAGGFEGMMSAEGIDLKIDFLMLRRDSLGAFVMLMYLPGNTPSITIEELGQKLDATIVKLVP